MVILLYQLVVAGVILAASLAGGRRGLWIATGFTGVWTLTHVVMPWLVGLQAITIMLAFTAGRKLVRGPGRLYVLRGHRSSP